MKNIILTLLTMLALNSIAQQPKYAIGTKIIAEDTTRYFYIIYEDFHNINKGIILLETKESVSLLINALNNLVYANETLIYSYTDFTATKSIKDNCIYLYDPKSNRTKISILEGATIAHELTKHLNLFK